MSTPEQLRGDSLRRQLTASEEWCRHHGYVFDSSMRDLGVSAYRGANRLRGALGRFIELAESGEIEPGSALLIESLDRLSREEILTALGLFTRLLSAGVEVITLADGQHYTRESINNVGNLVISLFVMARAHEESAMKSHRLSAAWAAKRSNAFTAPLTSRVPHWLRLDRGTNRIVEISERAQIVREIFKSITAGLGRRRIIRDLNERGVPPFGSGQMWHESYVSKILANRAVLGEYQPYTGRGRDRRPSGDPIQHYYPVIIDEQMFYLAQAASSARRLQGGRRGQRFSNLLMGMGRCAKCGGTMRYVNKGANPKSGGPYLVCSHAIAGSQCDHRRHYPYRGIEAIFLNIISEHIDLVAATEVERQKLAETTRENAALNAKLAEQDRAIENYTSLFELADPESLGPIQRRYTDILAQRLETQMRIEELRGTAAQRSSASGDLDDALFGVLHQAGKSTEEQFVRRARFNQALRHHIQVIEFTPSGYITALLTDGERISLTNTQNHEDFKKDMRVAEYVIGAAADNGLDHWVDQQTWNTSPRPIS